MKPTILKTFSESVKKVMQEKNISAKDLAEKSAISYSSLTPIINGNRDCSITKLIAITNALDCPINTLLPNLLSHHDSQTQTTKMGSTPQYLVVFISQASVTYCLIYEAKSKQQKIITLPYDFGCRQNPDDFTDQIFATIYAAITKNFSTTPPSKNIAVFVSAQQHEGTTNREKIQKTANSLFAKFILETDVITNYHSLLNTQNGICITINNGSAIIYSTDHGKSFIKVQGYGFPITDTAGNEWIGCEAIRYVIKVKENMLPGTILSDKILALYNDDANSIAENALFEPIKTHKIISAIVKELMHIEPVAYKIVEKSARLLLRQVKQIDRTTKNLLPIALTGDLASIYKDFFPQERLITPSQKLSTILLNYGLTVLKKTTKIS